MAAGEDRGSTTRELVRLVGAEGLKTEEQRQAFADDLADEVVAAVQAERKRQGLPPLPER